MKNKRDAFQVGAALPEFMVGPLVAADFVRYAAASGDYNPLHTDPAFAQAAGLDGVIAHGMLVMGFLGRFAANVARPTGLQSFDVRFRAPTRPGETLRCGGTVTAHIPHSSDATLLHVDLWVRGADDQLKASGTCTVVLPDEAA